MNALKACAAAMLVPVAMLTLVACASVSNKPTVDALKSQAGASVPSFDLPDAGMAWETVGDHWMLVQDPAMNTWLVKTGVCPGLSNVTQVFVTTKNKTVVAGKDALVRPGVTGRCSIEEIRALADFSQKIGTPHTLAGMDRPDAAPLKPFLSSR